MQNGVNRQTDDIGYHVIPNRKWGHVKDALFQFGGNRAAIKACICDLAPEFGRACKELSIAVFDGTPGRVTAHGTIERANRTALEWGRPGLEQSGLEIEWAALAIRHGLMLRRLITGKDGVHLQAEIPRP